MARVLPSAPMPLCRNIRPSSRALQRSATTLAAARIFSRGSALALTRARLLRRQVDVEVMPGREEVVRVLAVSTHPGRAHRAADAIGAGTPRRLGGDDARHRGVHAVALRSVGCAAALFVERVVLGVLEPREVRVARTGPVEDAHEIVRDVTAPAEPRELQLTRVRGLDGLRESLDLEFHPDADVTHAAK